MAGKEGKPAGLSGGAQRHPRHGADAQQSEEQQAAGDLRVGSLGFRV